MMGMCAGCSIFMEAVRGQDWILGHGVGSDGFGAQCAGAVHEDMWDNARQSGARVYLRWKGQCIKGSKGHFGGYGGVCWGRKGEDHVCGEHFCLWSGWRVTTLPHWHKVPASPWNWQ